VWRVDDTPEVFERRLAEHATAEVQVQKAFEDANVPWLSADNARSELGTFADIAAFLQVRLPPLPPLATRVAAHVRARAT